MHRLTSWACCVTKACIRTIYMEFHASGFHFRPRLKKAQCMLIPCWSTDNV